MWYWLVQYLADVEVKIVCVDFRHGRCLDARDDGSETNVFTPFPDDQRSCELTIAGSRKRAKRRAVAPMRQLCGVHSLVRGSSGQKHCSAGFVQSVGDSIFDDRNRRVYRTSCGCGPPAAHRRNIRDDKTCPKFQLSSSGAPLGMVMHRTVIYKLGVLFGVF